jgi:hypothetical protein
MRARLRARLSTGVALMGYACVAQGAFPLSVSPLTSHIAEFKRQNVMYHAARRWHRGASLRSVQLRAGVRPKQTSRCAAGVSSFDRAAPKGSAP